MFLEALTFQAGYNASLVTLGALLLGVASGVTGTFLFLRKRALVSDAISHATLPGVGLAFILMVSLGFDGRSLPIRRGRLVVTLSRCARLWGQRLTRTPIGRPAPIFWR